MDSLFNEWEYSTTYGMLQYNQQCIFEKSWQGLCNMMQSQDYATEIKDPKYEETRLDNERISSQNENVL